MLSRWSLLAKTSLRDVWLAVAVCVVATGTSMASGRDEPNAAPLDVLAYLMLIGGSAVLLLRRRFPVSVFVLTCVATFGYYWANYPDSLAILMAGAGLYTMAAEQGPLRGTLAGAALVVVLTGVEFAVRAGDTDWGWHLLGMPAWTTAVVSTALVLRARRAAQVAAETLAREQVLREAEEQRLSIAREVHDVVAHSLAMINVQAGVAAHVADRRPEQAREALLAIKEASRAALADLRATVAVLRGGTDRNPAPSLRQLDHLLAAPTAAGLKISVSGEPGELPAPVDTAAYRIVQEALTNVVRHAVEASAVTVHFGRNNGEFRLCVTDDGRQAHHGDSAGNGLRGMGERTNALGGSLTSGPLDEGGWHVSARFPV